MAKVVIDNKKKETTQTLFMLGFVFLFSVFWLIISFIIENPNDYEPTIGYLIDYEVDSSSGQAMYTLIYSYNALGKEYTVSSSGKVGMLPRINSPRPVKYNPNNPEEALIPSLSHHFLFSFLGVFGIIISSLAFTMELNKLPVATKLKNILNLIIRFVPGFLMIFLAYIITYIATGYFSFIKKCSLIILIVC